MKTNDKLFHKIAMKQVLYSDQQEIKKSQVTKCQACEKKGQDTRDEVS